MARLGGYAGFYLEIDLSSMSIAKKELPYSWARDFLGGSGFAAKVLWDRVKLGIDPFSPENLLVIALGPATGTFAHATGRWMIASKSPLTCIWGESHVGGHFGPELKYAGYDMIIIHGRSDKPVYLCIDDDYVELKDASHLWGKSTKETILTIQEEMGDPSIQVACIGPAGEKLVRYANVIVDFYDAAGRTGMGAIMGSKRLKAIAVRGSKGVKPADPDAFYEAAKAMYEKATSGIWWEISEETLRRYGTPYLVDVLYEIGRLPTKNHWSGIFERAEAINGESLKKYRISKKSCFDCFIQCKMVHHIKAGSYKCTLAGGPEYEGLVALGSNLLIDDLEAIIHANQLCNEYGLDVISAGKVIGWVMECYERGLLTKEDTDGIEFRWGDSSLLAEIIQKIATRDGFGDLLAEGALRASKAIGRGTERYVIHVKGLEASAQDGRAHKSIGLAHAVNVRGADHLRGLCTYDELPWATKFAYERFGEEEAKKMVIDDRLDPRGKGYLTWVTENFYAVVDSIITCKYGAMWPMIYYYEDFAPLLGALTGVPEHRDPRELARIGERICVLRRCFNIREGLSRKDDTLPERMLKEPLPSGPAKGQVVELDLMLDEYYAYRGCDLKTGLPKRDKLEELGLLEVARELEKMDKLI